MNKRLRNSSPAASSSPISLNTASGDSTTPFPIFFFFQAEDVIRDDLVTGVQTCALPICSRFARPGIHRATSPALEWIPGPRKGRSEERRVGKSVDLGGRRIIKKKKR